MLEAHRHIVTSKDKAWVVSRLWCDLQVHRNKHSHLSAISFILSWLRCRWTLSTTLTPPQVVKEVCLLNRATFFPHAFRSCGLQHINSIPFAILVHGWSNMLYGHGVACTSALITRHCTYLWCEPGKFSQLQLQTSRLPQLAVWTNSLQSADRGSEDVTTCNHEPRVLPGYWIGLWTCVPNLKILVSVLTVSPVTKPCFMLCVRHPAAMAPRRAWLRRFSQWSVLVLQVPGILVNLSISSEVAASSL